MRTETALELLETPSCGVHHGSPCLKSCPSNEREDQKKFSEPKCLFVGWFALLEPRMAECSVLETRETFDLTNAF